jgi:hypothetical protein
MMLEKRVGNMGTSETLKELIICSIFDMFYLEILVGILPGKI